MTNHVTPTRDVAETGAVWAIVVAAGFGRRFGAEKQFASLDGKPVHRWSIDAARAVSDGVVLVVPPGREDEELLRAGADRVVAGGETRAASVRAGLAAIPESAAVVLVHDAARPMASIELFRSVLEAVRHGAPAAIPGVTVTDTVKSVRGAVVEATLDRSSLVRVQTPQAFEASLLRRAHVGEPDATDDAALVEALGVEVVVVPGEDANLKITSPEDLRLLEWRLAEMADGRPR